MGSPPYDGEVMRNRAKVFIFFNYLQKNINCLVKIK